MKLYKRNHLIAAHVLAVQLAVMLCLAMTPDISHAKSAPSQLASRPGCPGYCSGDIAVSKRGGLQSFIVRGDLPHGIPGGPFQIWLQTAAASPDFVFVDSMELSSGSVIVNGDRWQLKLLQSGSAPAALGVTDLDDLSGLILHIRDNTGTVVYLEGAVPLTSGQKMSGKPLMSGAIEMQRPEIISGERQFGLLNIAVFDTVQDLRVTARKLDDIYFGSPTPLFFVDVETGPETDEYVRVGALSHYFIISAGSGYELSSSKFWQLELRGAAGSSRLPGDLRDLAGCGVRITDMDGKIYLSTRAPGLSSGKLPTVKRSGLLQTGPAVPGTAASGTITISFQPSMGRSLFELRTKNLSAGHSYGVWIEDGAASGILVYITDLNFLTYPTDGGLKLTTATGEPLPFGVSVVLELSGRRIEIRDETNAVHLSGIIP